jgi:ring-1,2-phenylacetyl-CoA epoxidase subunit PaaA
MSSYAEVKTPQDFKNQPEEYQTAVKKILVSHAVNELYGAQVFDEPAIKFAPTPYAKWLTCRVAMEEYHHHVRFKGLADELGVPPENMDTKNKKPLNIFEFPLASWEEFCVIKMVADLAEILQVEDLLHCSYVPLRNVARTTMPEERFHAQFGKDFCTELIKTPEGKARVQDALNRYFPYLPRFFGAPNSRNNEMYRKYGLKQRRNEEMREDYMNRVRTLVEGLDLVLPEVPATA